MNKIDLFIAGVQKSGSTSLYQYLVQHPDLLSHPQKEMTFFYNDDEYAQGYSASIFSTRNKTKACSLFL